MSRPAIVICAGPSFKAADYPKLYEKGDLCVLNYAHQGLADSGVEPPKFFMAVDTADRFYNGWYANERTLKVFAKQPSGDCFKKGLVNYEVKPFQKSFQWDGDYFAKKRILHPFKTINFAWQYLHHFAGYKRLAFYGSDMKPSWHGDMSRFNDSWYGVGEVRPPENVYRNKAGSIDVMVSHMRWQSHFLESHGLEWTSLTADSNLNQFMPYRSIEDYE